MLSNPPQTSALRSRQRQHRRQNSTPSAFDPVKIVPLPNLQPKRPISHRRGLSLDTRAHPLALAPAPGINSRPSSRQNTPRRSLDQAFFPSSDGSDAYVFSPQGTPQSRRFANMLPNHEPVDDLNGLSFDQYAASLGLFERPDSRLSGSDIDPSRDFDFFGADSALSTPSFLTFPESSPAPTQAWSSEAESEGAHSRRSSRRISNAIMDKVAKFEAMGAGAALDRPVTPSGQVNGFFSQTPNDTSAKQEATPQQRPNRFTDGYDESMEETLRPIRRRNDNRQSGIFQDLRKQAESMMQTPPRAGTIPMALPNPGLRTPDFMNMRTISAEFRKIEQEFGTFPTSPSTEASSAFNNMLNSSQDSFTEKPPLQPPVPLQSGASIPPLAPPSPSHKSPSRRTSPHRRNESLASLASAASIADINIEETRTETGVTLEDIAAYIQGPDPTDGKWRCLYEGCNKPFGRKENIKSHVQTHLNDRQYQCPTCKKCFVRQHDLKRHAKIHTGIKPYPCECGNSFARHDALTRHRQRGMCIGAFDGVVRKVVKRGRPKKIRPEMDERRDKAERTRRKNKLAEATGMSSASSVSGCSDVSGENSPSNDFDGLLDEDQFQGLLCATMPPGPATIHPTTLSVSSAPMPTTSGAPSMTDSFHSALSPSAMSNYSHASHHPSPAMSVRSLLPSTNSSATPTALADLTTTTAPSIPPSSTTAGPASASRPSSSNKPRTSRHPTPSTAPTHPAAQTSVPPVTTAAPVELVSSPSSPPPLLPTSSSVSSFSCSTASTVSVSSAASTSLSAAAARFFEFDGDDDEDVVAREEEVGDVSIGLGTTVAAHQAAAASSVGGEFSVLGGGGLPYGIGMTGMGINLGMAGMGGLEGMAGEFGGFAAASSAGTTNGGAGTGMMTSSPSPMSSSGSSASSTSSQLFGGVGEEGLHQGLLVGGGQMGKFDGLKFVDEDFDPVSMFTNGEDVFFGTA
ncbi:hypothetical protein VTJ49DRAFT_7738 [Mycothermus thermophilus]|uniref:C2H2-type domain-containing protein n=1 Tax=Humicola insolens TaxID=85995 RepID=A0ABR3VHI5_HUMIN